MCRFTFYLGPPIRLSALLIEPSHSLIRQSSHSREREEPLNGDGFGVGWYAHELTAEPAVFRSITPAWNNRNLHAIARVVTSNCIFAHVRAATRSSGVNESNCHPFRYDQYLCMHNGDIGDFGRMRRRLLSSVGDTAFANVFGSTDSEHFFAVIIDELTRLEDRMDPAERLTRALDNAICRVTDLAAELGISEPSYLNVAITDGQHAAVSRFADGGPPVSLYYFTGALYPQDLDSCGRAVDHDALAFTVSSERLSTDPGWQPVPANHIVTISSNSQPEFRPCSASLREACPA